MGAFLLVFSACKKQETIIEQLVPPNVTLYGSWMMIDVNQDSMKTYWVIPNDGSNIGYELKEDKYGFRTIENGSPFNVTDKQILFSSGLFNYKVSGDSLILNYSKNYRQIMLRVKNLPFDAEDYILSATVLKSVNNNLNNSNVNASIGVDNDTLYISTGGYLYKYNTGSRKVFDSISNSPFCIGFKSRSEIFLGYSGITKISKTNMTTAGTVSASSNIFNSVSAVSYNPVLNQVCVLQSNMNFYMGADGGTFSQVWNFSPMKLRCVVHYSGDTYLALKDNVLFKIKMGAKISVIAAYNIQSFSLRQLGTDGTNIWVFGYDQSETSYQYKKITLP